MKIASFFVIILFGLQGHAQEKIVWSKSDSTWAWVGQVEGSIFLIKRSYETRSYGETTIWVKMFNSPTRSKGKIIKKGTIEKILYVFDCPNKKMKIIQRVIYSSSDKLISSVTFEDYEQHWTNTVPETISEDLLKKACGLD